MKIPTALAGVQPFRIAGVYHDYTSVFGLISMDEKIFWKYWGDKRVDSFNIYLHAGASHEKAQEDIRSVVQERYAAFVLTNQELKQKVRDVVGQAFSIASYIEVMAMLIALLGLLNTLIVAVIERTREIAVIRTIGALARQVAKAIMFEGVLMGFVGAVLGVAAGSVLSAINVYIIPGIQAGFQIDYYFATEAVIKISIVSLVVALIAAFLPAYRAARTNLLEALEYE
jgi:putative ABC transport system permease protein